MPSKYLKPINTIKNEDSYLTFDLTTEPISCDFVVRDQVLSGEVVAICMGEVYALICDARDAKAVSKVRKIKNRPAEKTFGVLLDAKTISKIVDYDNIHSRHHDFFKDHNMINDLFGAKGFLRFPFDKRESVSSHVTSANMIQAFTFFGNDPAFFIEESLRRELRKKHKEGHGEILITSYNISGSPSITDEKSAHDLTKQTDLFVHIDRTDSGGEGSYSIYTFTSKGIEKSRHGTGSKQIDSKLKTK